MHWQSVEDKLDGLHPSKVMVKDLESQAFAKLKDMAAKEDSGLRFIVDGAPETVRSVNLELSGQ
jgi:hypothetical protein